MRSMRVGWTLRWSKLLSRYAIFFSETYKMWGSYPLWNYYVIPMVLKRNLATIWSWHSLGWEEGQIWWYRQEPCDWFLIPPANFCFQPTDSFNKICWLVDALGEDSSCRDMNIAINIRTKELAEYFGDSTTARKCWRRRDEARDDEVYLREKLKSHDRQNDIAFGNRWDFQCIIKGLNRLRSWGFDVPQIVQQQLTTWWGRRASPGSRAIRA